VKSSTAPAFGSVGLNAFTAYILGQTHQQSEIEGSVSQDGEASEEGRRLTEKIETRHLLSILEWPTR